MKAILDSILSRLDALVHPAAAPVDAAPGFGDALQKLLEETGAPSSDLPVEEAFDLEVATATERAPDAALEPALPEEVAIEVVPNDDAHRSTATHEHTDAPIENVSVDVLPVLEDAPASLEVPAALEAVSARPLRLTPIARAPNSGSESVGGETRLSEQVATAPVVASRGTAAAETLVQSSSTSAVEAAPASDPVPILEGGSAVKAATSDAPSSLNSEAPELRGLEPRSRIADVSQASTSDAKSVSVTPPEPVQPAAPSSMGTKAAPETVTPTGATAPVTSAETLTPEATVERPRDAVADDTAPRPADAAALEGAPDRPRTTARQPGRAAVPRTDLSPEPITPDLAVPAATSPPAEDATLALEVADAVEGERVRGGTIPLDPAARRAIASTERQTNDLDTALEAEAVEASPLEDVLVDAAPLRDRSESPRLSDVPLPTATSSLTPVAPAVALAASPVLEVAEPPVVTADSVPTDSVPSVSDASGPALGTAFDSASTSAPRPAAPLPSRLAVPAWLDRVPSDGQVRVSLGEDGSVHLVTARDADGTTVTVRFSDPELQALAAAHAPRLREVLEGHFEGAVRLSLDSAGPDADGQPGREPDRSPRSAPARSSAPTASSHTEPAPVLTGREWIG